MKLSDGWADTSHECFEETSWAHRPVLKHLCFPIVHAGNAYADALAKDKPCILTVLGKGIMGTMGSAMMTSEGAGNVEQGDSQEGTLSSSGVPQRWHRTYEMLLRPHGHLLTNRAATATASA